MAEIPEEVIVNILLLLPAVTLLRFRCVSKTWRNLIDSPNFVKSHLDHPKKSHSMIIFFTYDCAYYIDLASVCNAIDYPVLKELAYPWHGKDCYFGDVVGPYNGLFGVFTTTDDPGPGTAFLWNPLTRKHFQVPRLEMPDEVRICSWGLGYDSSSDDYKVVIITSSKELAWDDTDKLIVCVYSLKSGLWERIADFPYFSTHLEYPCVCVGDALHWKVLGPDRSYLIVELHLGKLEYHLVPQPLITSNNFNLGVLDGCLYAIYENWTDDGFDLVVMKEYGVEESWTLLISCTGWRNSFLVKPLSYTEDGDELIFITEFNIIVRYEFVTRSFRTMARRCLPRNLRDPLVYIPDLVCPQSGVRDGWHCDPRYSSTAN